MTEVTHNKKIKMGIAVLTITVLGVGSYLYNHPDVIQQLQSESPNETVQYSFEKPGQIVQPQHKENQFSDLTPEQLNLSAIDIMKQADAIMLANPVPQEPITPEQQVQLDKQIEQLEQQIAQMEKELKK